jgi:hypothetical protein
VLGSNHSPNLLCSYEILTDNYNLGSLAGGSNKPGSSIRAVGALVRCVTVQIYLPDINTNFPDYVG